MTVSVIELNAMSEAQAVELLAACCGANRWVSGMMARRPFSSREALLAAADLEMAILAPEDWREAFSHHPRIGEQQAAIPQSERGRRWSAGEQRGASVTTADVQQALARVNREYEARFGYIYIVCATGRSADELLAIARRRLVNDAETELQVAAGEQQKIMRNRLETLLQ